MSAKKSPEDLRFERQMTRLALLNSLMNGREINVEAAKKTAPSRAKPTEVLPPGGKPKGPTARPKAKKPSGKEQQEKEEKAYERAVDKPKGKPKQKEPKPGSAAYRKLQEQATEGLAPKGKKGPKGGAVPVGTTPESVERRDKFTDMSEQQLANLWTQRRNPKTGNMEADPNDTYTALKNGRIVPAGDSNLWFIEVRNPSPDPQSPGDLWIRMTNNPMNKKRARQLASMTSAVLWGYDPKTGHMIDPTNKKGAAALKKHWDEVQKVLREVDREKPERVNWQNWDALTPDQQQFIIREFNAAVDEKDPTKKIFGGKVTAEEAKMLMESPDVKGRTIRSRIKGAIRFGLRMYSAEPEKAKLSAEEQRKDNAAVTKLVEDLAKKTKNNMPVSRDLRVGKPWSAKAIRELYYENNRDAEKTKAEAIRHYKEIIELVTEVNESGAVKDEQGIPVRLKSPEIAALYYEADTDKTKVPELAKEKYTTRLQIEEKEEKEEAERKETARRKRRKGEKPKTREEEIKELEAERSVLMESEREAEKARQAEILSRKPTELRPGSGTQIGTLTWGQLIENPKLYNILALRNQEAITDVNTGTWEDPHDKQIFEQLTVPGLKAWIQGQLAAYQIGPGQMVTSDAVAHLIQQARQVDNPYLVHLGDYLEQISSAGDIGERPIPPHERQPEPPLT